MSSSAVVKTVRTARSTKTGGSRAGRCLCVCSARQSIFSLSYKRLVLSGGGSVYDGLRG